MCIKKIKHYSINDHASIYDEEALTALELAGRTAAKVNEVADSQNELVETTDKRLNAQDKKLTEQDEQLVDFRKNVIPTEVENAVDKLIEDGSFDAAISEYAGELEERVNNILESGSDGATLDAEVIDTRFGYDGTIYQNAGEAVRGQVEDLHKELANAKIIYSPELTLINGSYVENDGDVVVNGSYSYSEPVTLSAGYRVKLTARGYLTYVAMISKVVDGVHIPLVTSKDSTTQEYVYNVTETGEYVFSFATNEGYKLEVSTNLDAIKKGALSDLKADYIKELTLINGSYLNGEGETVANDTYCYTEPVYIPSGYTLELTARGYLTYVAMISKVVDGALVCLVKSNGSTVQTYKHTVKEGGEYVFSFNIDSGYSLRVRSSLEDSVKALEDSVKVLEDRINKPAITPSIPLSLFGKIGVIGDSYASGEMYFDESFHDLYERSWLQVLCRKIGATGYNFSAGGLRVESWFTHEKGFPLLIETEPCDLYYIALGINDANYDASIGGGYYPTFKERYKTLINNILNHKPNAKIIVSTMVANTDMKALYNTAIIECATELGIPYIVQEDDPFFTSELYTGSMVQNHPNAIGYAGMADAIERLTSQAIIDNLDYFSDLYMYEEVAPSDPIDYSEYYVSGSRSDVTFYGQWQLNNYASGGTYDDTFKIYAFLTDGTYLDGVTVSYEGRWIDGATGKLKLSDGTVIYEATNTTVNSLIKNNIISFGSEGQTLNNIGMEFSMVNMPVEVTQ